MEFGQVGNNAVTACPYCDEMLTVKRSAEGDLGVLMALYYDHLASSSACQEAEHNQPSFQETCDSLRPALQAENTKRQARMKSHPDNGRTGWWRVEGIRHDATARASSATEAIDKCEKAGAVGQWEAPEAHFLGEELPEVF